MEESNVNRLDGVPNFGYGMPEDGIVQAGITDHAQPEAKGTTWREHPQPETETESDEKEVPVSFVGGIGETTSDDDEESESETKVGLSE